MKTLLISAAAVAATLAGAAQAAPIYSDNVVWHDNGTNTDPARQDPTNAEGAPDQVQGGDINFLSLGLTTDADGLAFAIFTFDNETTYEGGEATPFEVTFGCDSPDDGVCENHPEAAQVYYGTDTSLDFTTFTLDSLQTEAANNSDFGYAGTVTNGSAQGGQSVIVGGSFSYILLVDATFENFSTSNSSDGFDVDAVSINPVPVPGAALLMGSGLAVAAMRRRRSK